MQLGNLIIKNYRCFQGKHNIQFPEVCPGLFLLEGHGASTLIDALNIALYGRSPGEHSITLSLRDDQKNRLLAWSAGLLYDHYRFLTNPLGALRVLEGNVLWSIFGEEVWQEAQQSAKRDERQQQDLLVTEEARLAEYLSERKRLLKLRLELKKLKTVSYRTTAQQQVELGRKECQRLRQSLKSAYGSKHSLIDTTLKLKTASVRQLAAKLRKGVERCTADLGKVEDQLQSLAMAQQRAKNRLLALKKQLANAQQWQRGYQNLGEWVRSEVLAGLSATATANLIRLGLEDWRVQVTCRRDELVVLVHPRWSKELLTSLEFLSQQEQQLVEAALAGAISDLVLPWLPADCPAPRWEFWDRPGACLSDWWLRRFLEWLKDRATTTGKQLYYHGRCPEGFEFGPYAFTGSLHLNCPASQP